MIKARRAKGDDTLAGCKTLARVVRQHNWRFAEALARYSTKAFVAAVVPGAHDNLHWDEEPQFGSKVVRAIVTPNCANQLRDDIVEGLRQCSSERFKYDLVNMAADASTPSPPAHMNSENATLRAIDAVRTQMWKTDFR